MFELEDEFYELAHVLRSEGYNVNISNKNLSRDHLFATNSMMGNQDIYFGFCTPCIGVFEELNGKIAAYVDVFDCWRNCILILPLPRNLNQTEFILDSFNDIKCKRFHDRILSYDYGSVYNLI